MATAEHTNSLDEQETQDMIGCLLKKCRGCLENYSDDRRPRNLLCGHSLCTVCLSSFSGGVIECIECSLTFPSRDVELPVNYPLLKMIKVPEVRREFTIKSEDVQIYPVFAALTPECPQDELYCGVHSSKVSWLCCSCNTWICHDCLVLDHPVNQRGSCRVLGMEDGIKLIKTQYKKELEELLKHKKNSWVGTAPKRGMRDFCTKHCPDAAGSHKIVKEKIETCLEYYKMKHFQLFEELRLIIGKSQQIESSVCTIDEMKRRCAYLNEGSKFLMKAIPTLKHDRDQVMNLMTTHLRMDLTILVKTTPLFTVKEEGMDIKWAPIQYRQDICSKNSFLLYSLRDGDPPRRGIIVPYEFMDRLLSGIAPTAFLEIGTSAKLNFISVHCFENRRGKQFMMMCTGSRGVSYRNTCFYSKTNGCLQGGDYENNDGTGGVPIIQTKPDIPAGDLHNMTAGAVGFNGPYYGLSTRFYIQLSVEQRQHFCCVGRVCVGLPILQHYNSIPDITQLIVKECGVVVQM